MANQDALLQKLLGDPKLLKILQDLSKQAPKERKVKKLKELGNPSYVNRVQIKCKLCGAVETAYMCMSFDPEEKLYRGSCYHKDNIWPDLPVHEMMQRKPNCILCPSMLDLLSKTELIEKCISLAQRLG